MKAVLIHEFGPIENLEFSEYPTPTIKPDQILVKVAAVALNHLDLFVRAGIPGLTLKMPHILGSDISGEIEEIGNEVPEKDLEPGNKIVVDPGISCGKCRFCQIGETSLCRTYGVIGEHVRGGYAEYLAIPWQNAVSIPKNNPLSMTESAAIPLTFMTAYRMVKTRAHVKKSEDVLITGIGGGVALAALQIARMFGARVFVTSSSDEKLAKAKKLGADLGINYVDNPDYHKEVFYHTDRRGVDVVIDSSGQENWQKNMRSLRKGGRLVTCGATTGPRAVTNLNLLFWNQLELIGSTMASRQELREVLDHVWRGNLEPVIDTVLPLSKAQDAQRILEAGKQFGKVVMKP
ncbi:MAG: zinc-binding dehydrogenase [Candidatus Heimdallarchaeota archaeon]